MEAPLEAMERILKLTMDGNAWRNRYSESFDECYKLKTEAATWSHRALEEQRRAAGLAVELDNLKTFIREEVVDQIYGQNKGGPELIAKTRAMVSLHNKLLSDQ